VVVLGFLDADTILLTGDVGESPSNKAIIELVATAVGVRPYQVTLANGHYHPRKVVQIQDLCVEELQARLANLQEAK